MYSVWIANSCQTLYLVILCGDFDVKSEDDAESKSDMSSESEVRSESEDDVGRLAMCLG